MQYIVKWLIITIVSIPCPDYGKTDKFGRVINPNVSCLVMHVKLDTAYHSQVFLSRLVATEFYSELVQERDRQGVSIFAEELGISDVKLDSTTVISGPIEKN